MNNGLGVIFRVFGDWKAISQDERRTWQLGMQTIVCTPFNRCSCNNKSISIRFSPCATTSRWTPLGFLLSKYIVYKCRGCVERASSLEFPPTRSTPCSGTFATRVRVGPYRQACRVLTSKYRSRSYCLRLELLYCIRFDCSSNLINLRPENHGDGEHSSPHGGEALRAQRCDCVVADK